MNLLAYFSVLISVLFFACGSEVSNREIEGGMAVQSNQRQINDSLLLAAMQSEMEAVEAGIDELIAFTDKASSGKMNRRDFQAKVKKIDNLVKEQKEQIAKLEQELKAAGVNSPVVKLLEKNLEDKRRLVEQQARELIQLKNRVGELESENLGLKTEKVELTQTVKAQDQEISNINQQVNEAKMLLSRLQAEIQQSQGQAQNLQKQLNREYMRIATELVEIADDAKGVLGSAKGTRKDCAEKAFDYFCLAHKNGEYSALTQIQRLKDHKKLGKFVAGKDCYK